MTDMLQNAIKTIREPACIDNQDIKDELKLRIEEKFEDIKAIIRLNDNGQKYKQWSIKVLNRKLNIEQHES